METAVSVKARGPKKKTAIPKAGVRATITSSIMARVVEGWRS
jgi:hypothetical protein